MRSRDFPSGDTILREQFPCAVPFLSLTATVLPRSCKVNDQCHGPLDWPNPSAVFRVRFLISAPSLPAKLDLPHLPGGRKERPRFVARLYTCGPELRVPHPI